MAEELKAAAQRHIQVRLGMGFALSSKGRQQDSGVADHLRVVVIDHQLAVELAGQRQHQAFTQGGLGRAGATGDRAEQHGTAQHERQKKAAHHFKAAAEAAAKARIMLVLRGSLNGPSTM